MKKETYQERVERINKANAEGLDDIFGKKPSDKPENDEAPENDEDLKKS